VRAQVVVLKRLLYELRCGDGIARARDAVLLVTQGRVNVLAGERLDQLRADVDAIRQAKPR
jgi:hypothetical protein